jgi:hypothetical protein
VQPDLLLLLDHLVDDEKILQLVDFVLGGKYAVFVEGEEAVVDNVSSPLGRCLAINALAAFSSLGVGTF